MKLKSKLFLPIVILITLTAIISIYLSKKVITDLINGQIQQQETQLYSELEDAVGNQITRLYNSIERITRKATEEATIFSALSPVQDAYRLALKGNIHDENDLKVLEARNALRKFIKPVLDAHKRNTGLEQFHLHFHLPSNRSFLRVWLNGWQIKRNGQKLDVSDDLSPFRAMVVEINQGNHQAIGGIEVGKGGLAIRGVTPITASDGTYLGSNEIFLEFNNALKVRSNFY